MSEASVGGRLRPLTACLVDMNHGHANQAMRCLRGIVARFFERVRERNPDLSCVLTEVSPRDTQAVVPGDCDLYLSSGGPGSPYDGHGLPWVTDYARFLDGVVESAARGGADQRLFVRRLLLLRDDRPPLRGRRRHAARRAEVWGHAHLHDGGRPAASPLQRLRRASLRLRASALGSGGSRRRQAEVPRRRGPRAGEPGRYFQGPRHPRARRRASGSKRCSSIPKPIAPAW